MPRAVPRSDANLRDALDHTLEVQEVCSAVRGITTEIPRTPIQHWSTMATPNGLRWY
jgi:hypothetical protein